jgi:hypothetical protein
MTIQNVAGPTVTGIRSVYNIIVATTLNILLSWQCRNIFLGYSALKVTVHQVSVNSTDPRRQLLLYLNCRHLSDASYHMQIPKPASYKLTNGEIGRGKSKLIWCPEDDDDTVALDCLPTPVDEAADPVECHINSVSPLHFRISSDLDFYRVLWICGSCFCCRELQSELVEHDVAIDGHLCSHDVDIP